MDVVHDDVWGLVADGPFAPVFDLPVDLPVQTAHGGGSDPGTPQELRDILYSADRYAGKVHLNEEFLVGRFATFVAFDDGRFEGCQAEFRDGRLHFAGGRQQFAPVMAAAIIFTFAGAFALFGVAQLGGLFDGLPDDSLQIALEAFLVDFNYIA